MNEEIKKQIESMIAPKPFLTASEVAQIFEIPPDEFIAWNTKAPKSRRLPQIKIGTEPRFPRPAVVEWVMKRLSKGVA